MRLRDTATLRARPANVTVVLPAVPDAPPVQHLARIGMAGVAVFVGGFGLWAAFAPLSTAAVGPGQIKVEGNRKTLQHLEGGIISELLVHDGDKIARGQVLMRLSNAQPGAQVASFSNQRLALLAQDARLIAERDGSGTIAFSPDLTASADSRAAESMAGQQSIFTSRRAAIEGQIAILNQRIAEAGSEIDSHKAQVRALDQQIALMKEELDGAQQLFAKGYEPKTHILAMKRDAAGLDGARGDQLGQIARAEQTISESRLQISETTKQRASEVATELTDVETRLTETTQRLRAASDIEQRTEIRAPLSGSVVGLRFFTTGGVIRPGDPILDIVPDKLGLVVETRIKPSEVANIQPGLPAKVRLTAFKQRVVPLLDGTVTMVSADALHDHENGEPYYSAEIEIDAAELALLKDVKLISGMPAQVVIPTGERTLLDYLLSPLRESYSRALSER
jgi:HlyD family type I secretion membrane fusion protein